VHGSAGEREHARVEQGDACGIGHADLAVGVTRRRPCAQVKARGHQRHETQDDVRRGPVNQADAGPFNGDAIALTGSHGGPDSAARQAIKGQQGGLRRHAKRGDGCSNQGAKSGPEAIGCRSLVIERPAGRIFV
jgi:hypothetical protein